MLRCLTFIIVLVPLLNTANGQQAQSYDEYAVYNTVMREILNEDKDDESNRAYPVLLLQTKIDDVYLDHAKPYRGLLRSFHTANAQSMTLDERLTFGKHFLIDEADLIRYLEQARREIDKMQEEAKTQNVLMMPTPTSYWRPFYEKYPDAIGLYTLSRVGFTTNHEYALVVVSQDAAFTGYTRAYVLRKFKSGWKSIRQHGSQWIS
jgi:hypothetical protein